MDSPILIVGAMVLGPEFGPLAGLAVAIKRRDARRALQSLRAVAVGFALAILVTAAGVALLRAAGEAAGIAAAAVTSHYSDARGATVQLIINLLCIVAAAFVTLSVSERLTHSQPQRD